MLLAAAGYCAALASHTGAGEAMLSFLWAAEDFSSKYRFVWQLSPSQQGNTLVKQTGHW